ncbi:MAG: DoxX family protein [Elusimicrobiales bacterium]|jgi:uncharacterized membrane protein YphA (DoxX/SURF4 family)
MNEETRTKDIIGLLARLLAGGIFIYAGFLKAVAPAEEFAYAIETYKVVPAGPAMFAALTVPWIELYLGVFLAAGVFTDLAALAAGAMLLGFEGLLLQAMIRKLPVTSCGCFGASMHNSLGYEFFQNLLFLAAAALAWKYGGRFSIDSTLEQHG